MGINIFKSKVLSIKNLTRDVRLIRLSVPRNFDFRAGQYLSLSVFDKEKRKIRKPMSIANPPGEKSDYVEFCIKLIPGGLASEFVKKLRVGDEAELFGPAGKFFVDIEGKDKERDLFFIASGVGIAPFAGMILDLLNSGFDNRIFLLKSAKDEKGSLYDNEFSRLSKKYRNFEFHNIFSRPKGKSPDVGYVQDFLDKYVPGDFDGNFYICGLKEMIAETREKLEEMGFDENHIFEEKFD